MLSANLIGALLILWRGGWYDRAATLGLVAVVAITSLLQALHLPGILVWAALLDLVLFLFFWLLAERAGRWWIVALAGFQFIAVLAYAAPLLFGHQLNWAVVTVNWGVWVLDSLCVFAGVLEASMARRFSRETTDGTVLDRPNGSRPYSKVDTSAD